MGRINRVREVTVGVRNKVRYIIVIIVVLITFATGDRNTEASDKLNAEDLLYGGWLESTSEFEDDDSTWEEVISENNMVSEIDYTITKIERQSDDNIVVYWETDYMKARLELTSSSNYNVGEAQYYVDGEGYTGDSLYFKRVANRK